MDSPPGNDSVLEITTPTTYSGSTGGISIWEDTLQHEDTMIAVYLNRTFSWSTNFTVTGVNKATLAIETAPVDEFPQGTAAARLAAFRTAVLATAPDTSNITAAAPRFIYTNRHGHALDLTFRLAGKINGVSVDYQSWPMLEDPWMYQSQKGHLHLTGPNRVITSNYYDWMQSINNRPTLAPTTSVPASPGAPVDIDLAARVTDGETPDNQLRFAVSNPSNGSVALLADGKTARFTPATSGPASFDFSASDRGLHPRVVWHYDFESTTTGDASLQQRTATQTLVGTGTSTLESDTATPLGGNSTKSLRLTETSPSAAKLSRLVTRSNLEMSNGSWTFATWFKRATRTTDDFIFYIGTGDGFSGNGDELQLRCGANSDVIRLEHYNAANANDLTLVSPGTAVQNVWHHAAITFEKAADNTGSVRLYLNGTQVGAPTTVTWALRQDVALVLGGVTSNGSAVATRYLNDAALFRGAMTAPEIAALAGQSIATFSGLNVSSTVRLGVLTRQESWRQTHFGTTSNTGAAADLFDANNDGEVNLLEFGTGQNPHASTLTPTMLVKNSSTLDFTYTRSVAAILEGTAFTVEGSDTLAPGSWSSTGVTEQHRCQRRSREGTLRGNRHRLRCVRQSVRLHCGQSGEIRCRRVFQLKQRGFLRPRLPQPHPGWNPVGARTGEIGRMA